ncbi:MAG: hypothetical protein VX475_18970 [Myxococcota bacterium]|nr:hypothetical protein [Myxococcota bacterium]
MACAKKEVGETPFMLEVQPDDAIRTYRIELDGYESDAVTINPKALKEDYTVALEKRSEEDKKSDRGNKRRNSSTRNNRKNSGEDEKETTPAKVEETTPPAEKDPKTVDPPKETTPKSPVIDRLDDEEDKPNVERID